MKELAVSGGYNVDMFAPKRLAQTEAASLVSRCKELLEARRRTAINKPCEFSFVIFSDTTLPEKSRGTFHSYFQDAGPASAYISVRVLTLPVFKEALVAGSTYKMGFGICFDPARLARVVTHARTAFDLQFISAIPMTLPTGITYPVSDVVPPGTDYDSVTGVNLLIFRSAEHMGDQEHLALDTFARLFYTNGLSAVPPAEASERMTRREAELSPYLPVSWWNRFYLTLSQTLAEAWSNDDESPFQGNVEHRAALIIPGSNFGEMLAAGVYFSNLEDEDFSQVCFSFSSPRVRRPLIYQLTL